ENRDLSLAKQLWKRVVAAVGYDSEAFEAIERIAVRQVQSPIYPSSQPDIAITQPVNSSRGNTSTQENPSPNLSPARREALNSPPSLAGKGAGGLGSFQFEVITVNKQGEEINREKRQAKYFSEDLGDGVSLDMVYIPAGKFLMGSPEGERYDKEKPQHEVNVPEFFMGKYPVTQAQWRRVAALPKIKRDLGSEPSHFKGNKLPVEGVSQYDAVEFCARLSKHTGKQYRLPSEAEWEYACRAGTTTPFYFGETITGKLANYNASKTFANEAKREYHKETTPVGQFPPNPFGLYDMHGNLWEWCLDDWHDNYDGTPTDGSSWADNDNGYQVFRGGSWNNSPVYCRSTSRLNCSTDRNPSFPVGFRVVCAVGRVL
ncbi:MAG: formylglycine-generating enzyme family protein, partial [Rivularia sp. (in: cyanobacteria)]